jgi:hypothetical protein
MAGTAYKVVFDAFKDKITDYDFAAYSPDLQDELLVAYLDAACDVFADLCEHDLLDRDDALGTFSADLTREEIGILAEVMVVKWLQPIMNDTDNLHNRINTKEFTSISPANMLLALKESYESARTHAMSRMSRYSYMHSDVEKWKP